MLIARVFLILSIFSLVACGGSSFNSGSSNNDQPSASRDLEPAYYGTPRAISDPMTIQATAKFLYRPLNFSTTTQTGGLGAVVANSEALAIPFAEYHIYNSQNQRIQQGETSTSGFIQAQIPKTAGTYTLKVFSRALNSQLRVSVLDNLTDFAPHFVAHRFQVSENDFGATLALPEIYAQADESVSSKTEGGAFNIYYNVLLANEFIRRNIGKSNINQVGNTQEWWVAEKVQIFWTAGFNPYSYFGYASNGMSFYSPNERRLFILGGMLGNMSAADTDHFDDSVILHEYGHFLEDAYGNSQSPGGSHDGRSTIDPRLAWSEGFANYLQAAILTGAEASHAGASEGRIPQNKKFHYYVDTYGHSGSNQSGIGIAFNLLAASNDSYDNVSSELDGNGSFREISVARTLYKITRNTSETFNLTFNGGGVLFADFWKVFAGEDKNGANNRAPRTHSLRNTNQYPIAHAELFHELLNKIITPGSQYTRIMEAEKQRTTVFDYARPLSRSNNACAIPFNGATRDINKSHQQRSNDFYLFYHDGSNNTLSLNMSGNTPDLDLILYEKFYVYFEDANWTTGKSSPYIAKQSRTSALSESLNLAGLSSGYYVVNIKASMYKKDTTSTVNNYQLVLGSQYLCP